MSTFGESCASEVSQSRCNQVTVPAHAGDHATLIAQVGRIHDRWFCNKKTKTPENSTVFMHDWSSVIALSHNSPKK